MSVRSPSSANRHAATSVNSAMSLGNGVRRGRIGGCSMNLCCLTCAPTHLSAPNTKRAITSIALSSTSFVLASAQAIVGQFLATFQEFPPQQKLGSFSVDQALEKMMSQKRQLKGSEHETGHSFLGRQPPCSTLDIGGASSVVRAALFRLCVRTDRAAGRRAAVMD
jgi:hypothetical protein